MKRGKHWNIDFASQKWIKFRLVWISESQEQGPDTSEQTEQPGSTDEQTAKSETKDVTEEPQAETAQEPQAETSQEPQTETVQEPEPQVIYDYHIYWVVRWRFLLFHNWPKYFFSLSAIQL